MYDTAVNSTSANTQKKQLCRLPQGANVFFCGGNTEENQTTPNPTKVAQKAQTDPHPVADTAVNIYKAVRNRSLKEKGRGRETTEGLRVTAVNQPRQQQQ